MRSAPIVWKPELRLSWEQGGARLFGDLNAPDSLIRRTLDAHKDALKVLYPEKGTELFVFYLHLDEVFVAADSVATPMSPRLPQQEESHA